MTLPADSHVHSQWSWDAPDGAMGRSCERALELGLPGIAFTEHLDYTVWLPVDLAPDDHLASFLTPDGQVTPPPFDVEGYLAAVEECRDRFPALRVMSGLELGEPHWHRAADAQVLEAGAFDRVLGSLHCLAVDDGFTEPPGLYRRMPALEVVQRYLAEVVSLVHDSAPFSVLAHIDYPLRYWPDHAGPLELSAFEDELRHALRATAESGRALEVNTAIPLHATILRWWREEGGQSVTFGSDAHQPDAVARGFAEARAMAQAHGFRQGVDPFDVWRRG